MPPTFLYKISAGSSTSPENTQATYLTDTAQFQKY